MAAAYPFHIVQKYPFIDGNKRVGAVAADVFLSLNGVLLPAKTILQSLSWQWLAASRARRR